METFYNFSFLLSSLCFPFLPFSFFPVQFCSLCVAAGLRTEHGSAWSPAQGYSDKQLPKETCVKYVGFLRFKQMMFLNKNKTRVVKISTVSHSDWDYPGSKTFLAEVKQQVYG